MATVCRDVSSVSTTQLLNHSVTEPLNHFLYIRRSFGASTPGVAPSVLAEFDHRDRCTFTPVLVCPGPAVLPYQKLVASFLERLPEGGREWMNVIWHSIWFE